MTPDIKALCEFNRTRQELHEALDRHRMGQPVGYLRLLVSKLERAGPPDQSDGPAVDLKKVGTLPQPEREANANVRRPRPPREDLAVSD